MYRWPGLCVFYFSVLEYVLLFEKIAWYSVTYRLNLHVATASANENGDWDSKMGLFSETKAWTLPSLVGRPGGPEASLCFL